MDEKQKTQTQVSQSEPWIKEEQLNFLSFISAIGLIVSLFLPTNEPTVVFLSFLTFFKTLSFYYYDKKWDLVVLGFYAFALLLHVVSARVLGV